MIAPGRQTASEIGTKIDNRYEVLEELGRGGMGVVYKAADLKMDRIVAIKVMTAHVSGRDEYLERFLREARSVAKMQHPNIVVVHDYGYHDDSPYMVMEYVEGQALDKVIAARTNLSLLVKIDYLIQVCNALHYAHQCGIVHRDVKPGNIMVLEGGQRVKLLDFGIARAEGASSLSSGLAMGTTRYMSPEQTRGQKDLDHRADIFSAGVVLYELLAGRVPWNGNSDYEISNKIIHEPFPPLATCLQHYPLALDRVLDCALAKDVNARYQTAEKMASELAEVEAPLKEQALEDAIGRFERGDLVRASELVSQILRIDTRHHEALELRKKIQGLEPIDQKIEHIRQLRMAAEEAVGQKRYQDALAAIEQAISSDAANSELLQYRELIRQELKRRDEVRKKLELAKRAQEIKDLTSAQELVEKALEVDPTDTQARMMKSVLEEERRREQLQELAEEASHALGLRAFTRAKELIQQLEAADPRYGRLPSLKKTLLEAEEEERRRAELEKVVTEVRQVLKTGDVRESLFATEQALVRFPNDLRLVRLRAQAESLQAAAERERTIQEQISSINELAERGQAGDALRLAEVAHRRLGGDHRLETLVAQLRESAERERQARAEQQLLDRAREAMRTGDYDSAVRILSPGRIDVHLSEEGAQVLQAAKEALAQKKETLAQQAAERARQAAERTAESVRKREVSDALEKALAQDPDPDVQVLLANEAVRNNPGNERVKSLALGAQKRQQQVSSGIERAQAAERGGNYLESIREWERIRQVWPLYPGIDSHITRLREAYETAIKPPPPPPPPPPLPPRARQVPPKNEVPADLPETKPFPKTLWLGLVLGIAVLAVASILYFVFRPGSEAAIRFETDPPGALISIGGRTCTSPCELKLKQGNYTVEASRDGYTAAQKPITVGSHSDTIALNLSPTRPSVSRLSVEVNQDQVDIFVDGSLKGVTAPRQATLSLIPGKHQITVGKSGYVTPEAQSVDLAADGEAALTFTLNPGTDTKPSVQADPFLMVSSKPEAKILIDTREVGTVSADGTSSIKTTPGKHQVQLTLPGFQSWSKLVTVKVGDRLPINADLKEIPKPAPSITAFNLSPSNILQGQTATLQWETQYATDVKIDPIGSVPAKGSMPVNPTSSTTYTLTATGEGTVHQSIPLTVSAQPKPTISRFDVGSDQIQQGQKVKIFWSTQHASDVSITPEVGPVDPEGAIEVKPSKTTTYTLTARGAGGVDSKSAQVIVDEPQKIAAPPPPPPPGEEPEVKAIEETLHRYRDAYETMDIEELKRVWYPIPKNIEKALKDSFNAASKIKMHLDCGAPKVTGDSAQCTCSESLVYTYEKSRKPTEDVTITFQLQKTGGKWHIVSQH